MTQDYTHRFTEVWELGGMDADVYTPAVYTINTWRSMGNHQRGVAILHVGDMDQGATVDFELWQATDTTGAGAKIIPGKFITQLTQAGGDAGSTVCIELRTEELDVNGGFDCIAPLLTVAGGSCDIGVLGLLGCSNYSPVPTTSWTEIVD
jgi:hypothetical protein